MNDRDDYTPGPAGGAEIRKEGENWTLILVRVLHHSPQKVWEAITDPAQLREWAPFDADGNQLTTEHPIGDIATNTWSYENQNIQTVLPDESIITYTYAPVTRQSDEYRLSREDDVGAKR